MWTHSIRYWEHYFCMRTLSNISSCVTFSELSWPQPIPEGKGACTIAAKSQGLSFTLCSPCKLTNKEEKLSPWEYKKPRQFFYFIFYFISRTFPQLWQEWDFSATQGSSMRDAILCIKSLFEDSLPDANVYRKGLIRLSLNIYGYHFNHQGSCVQDKSI